MWAHDVIEFGVASVKSSKNHATVDGRCYLGLIVPERVFTVLSEATVQSTPEVCGPTTLNPISTVELKVEAIWAYGRQINELSPGMTARLELSGIGAEKIVEGLVLT